MHKRTWKGNIRELQNFIERLVTLASPEATRLESEHFPTDLQGEFNQFALHQEADVENKPLKERLEACEDRIIRQALMERNWNQSEAARVLKISEQNMRYRMKRLGVTRPK